MPGSIATYPRQKVDKKIVKLWKIWGDGLGQGDTARAQVTGGNLGADFQMGLREPPFKRNQAAGVKHKIRKYDKFCRT
jgi:hypothetical protein